jgi:hypothetical protein
MKGVARRQFRGEDALASYTPCLSLIFRKFLQAGAGFVVGKVQPLALPCLRVCLRVQANIKSEDKAVPLQAWTGPEGSRKLGLPDFKTVDT